MRVDLISRSGLTPIADLVLHCHNVSSSASEKLEGVKDSKMFMHGFRMKAGFQKEDISDPAKVSEPGFFSDQFLELITAPAKKHRSIAASALGRRVDRWQASNRNRLRPLFRFGHSTTATSSFD
jgi:hypothetical protein